MLKKVTICPTGRWVSPGPHRSFIMMTSWFRTVTGYCIESGWVSVRRVILTCRWRGGWHVSCIGLVWDCNKIYPYYCDFAANLIIYSAKPHETSSWEQQIFTKTSPCVFRKFQENKKIVQRTSKMPYLRSNSGLTRYTKEEILSMWNNIQSNTPIVIIAVINLSTVVRDHIIYTCRDVRRCVCRCVCWSNILVFLCTLTVAVFAAVPQSLVFLASPQISRQSRT